MDKLKKILLCLLIFEISFTFVTYAKYKYDFERTIIKLSRDDNNPICDVSYSTDNWTNEDVKIIIKSNKKLEQVSGFSLSKDKKKLTKCIDKNESAVIKIKDLSGNITDVEYNVENIDKEPPKIIGCKNNDVLVAPIELKCIDNCELKEFYIDKYSEKLEINLASNFYTRNENEQIALRSDVIEHPLNTKQYSYYLNDEFYSTSSDSSYIFVDLKPEKQYTIKIQALDSFGKVLDERIVTTQLEDIEKDMKEDKLEKNKNPNLIIEKGKYQIYARDCAGNEVTYYIKVK